MNIWNCTGDGIQQGWTGTINGYEILILETGYIPSAVNILSVFAKF